MRWGGSDGLRINLFGRFDFPFPLSMAGLEPAIQLSITRHDVEWAGHPSTSSG